MFLETTTLDRVTDVGVVGGYEYPQPKYVIHNK